MSGRRTALGLAALGAVLAADQASKYWVVEKLALPARGRVPGIEPVLTLAMVWNRGVTFGLLNGVGAAGPWLLGGVALLVAAALFLWLHRAETAVVAVSLGAIAGGAIGNVIDRMRYGAVIDFLHLHAGAWDPFPYVFNVADASICCGVAALLIDGLLPRRRDDVLAEARHLRHIRRP